MSGTSPPIYSLYVKAAQHNLSKVMSRPPSRGPNWEITEGPPCITYFNAGLTSLVRGRQPAASAEYTWPPNPFNTPCTSPDETPEGESSSTRADTHPTADTATMSNQNCVANRTVPALQLWQSDATISSMPAVLPACALGSTRPTMRIATPSIVVRDEVETRAAMAKYQAFLAEERERYPRSFDRIDSVSRLREDLADVRAEFSSLCTLYRQKLAQVKEELISIASRLQRLQGQNALDDSDKENAETDLEGSSAPMQEREALDELHIQTDRLKQDCVTLLNAADFGVPGGGDDDRFSSQAMDLDGL